MELRFFANGMFLFAEIVNKGTTCRTVRVCVCLLKKLPAPPSHQLGQRATDHTKSSCAFFTSPGFLYSTVFTPWWVSSSSSSPGTTWCSGTCWACGGCSLSCSTAGLCRCRGSTSSRARRTPWSGGYATTWRSSSTTCSTTYRWALGAEPDVSVMRVNMLLECKIVFNCVLCSRWTFWSLSSLSCFSRSTPPETLRASDWPTTTSWVTCWLSPSSCWSR